MKIDFTKKPIFGMIHLAGLDSQDILNRAIEEIKIMEEEGVDGIIVENYHGGFEDVVFVLKNLPKTNLIVGLNILPNEYKDAFKLANDYDASFIQLDYVSGIYNRSLSQIDSEHYLSIKNNYPNISVLGGVHPKYYDPIEGSILENDLKDGVERAEAIVVTGAGTGKETPLDKIKNFRNILGNYPLIIGAGLTPGSVKEQLSIADGAIVGSAFKPYNHTMQKVSRKLVRNFMIEVKKLRG